MVQTNISVHNPISTVGGEFSFTSAAVNHVKKILTNQVGKKSFRLSVKRSGCSGFSYVVDYVDSLNPNPNDLQFSIDNGLIVFVDQASYPVLKGICIDYVQDGLNGALKFLNPNQMAVCGCGESFSIGEQ